jgi:glycosyltransferase involved in cell wall biosynthesis
MKLSVVMITYNHGLYLKKAIESILNQITNFDFELIVSSDASPDNTDSVVESIINKHPKGNFIKYTSHQKNIGVMPNFYYALKQATGQYVALCEGDDYWTNENKLQIQVDFLEKNEKFAICYHAVSIDENNEIKHDTITKNTNKETTILDLAKGNFMHTCSVVYRNYLFAEFPNYFTQSPIGDYYLHMLNARFGNIYFFEENMANYRVHDSSYWSSKKQAEREIIWVTFLKNILPDFDLKIQKILLKQIYKIEKKTMSFSQKTSYFLKTLFN